MIWLAAAALLAAYGRYRWLKFTALSARELAGRAEAARFDLEVFTTDDDALIRYTASKADAWSARAKRPPSWRLPVYWWAGYAPLDEIDEAGVMPVREVDGWARNRREADAHARAAVTLLADDLAQTQSKP